MNFTTKKPLLSTLVAVILFCFVDPAYSHFIWVAKHKQDGTVQIYFGEGPHPDQAQFLTRLSDLKVWAISKNGQIQAIDVTKKMDGDNGWFETTSKPFAVDADCAYGVFSRGDTSMFLHYSAKYIDYVPNFESKSTGHLPLDITFRSSQGKTTFKVLHKGQPAPDCELQITDHAGNSHVVRTNQSGVANHPDSPQGRWQIRAKKIDETAGSVDNKTFSEKRYYCTLVVGVDHAHRKQSTKTMLKSDAKRPTIKVSLSTPFPELPVGITSFGGAVAGDSVYVFGGHCGEAHNYYRSGQNQKLLRLNLQSSEGWEFVSKSTGLQGLAMIEHKGQLYRIGGFEARNEQGQAHDLHSVAEFARFDFETKTWTPLSPMPAARSSLDAVVIGNRLFVVGGWTMKGTGKPDWCTDALMFDLDDVDGTWKSIETPFQRRALSVGFQGNKLYAVGGMQKNGGPTRKVQVLDIDELVWADGPTLPGSGAMEGFGSSCFNIGGNLIVSTYSGEVLRLNEKKDRWNKIYQLETGRFFHRLLPLSHDKLMLVGGANMDVGKLHEVQVLSLEQ